MKNFRTFFLAISLFQLLVSADCFAADPEAPETPKHLIRKAAGGPEDALTPGGFLSLKQAELRKEKFEEALGVDVVAEWGIDWDIFARSDASPHLPGKIVNIRRLVNFLKGLLAERYDEPFTQLYGEASTIHARMEAVHLQRLKGVVQAYFEALFEGAAVECKPKHDGVQLGTIVNITTPAEETFKYYVKTHSVGKLTSKSTAPKRVNPGELLVYKILEHLGVGCESHFCARSPEDVYIATLDARHGSEFFLFEAALKDEDGLGTALWGGLGALDRDPRNNDWNAVEVGLDADHTARHFVEKLATVDALSRILSLHDLLNNPDNYGYSRETPEFPITPRIIDFRVPETKDLPFTESNFKSFLIGNGLFNYVGAHKTIAFTLRHRPVAKRVETSRWILEEGSLSTLPAIMAEAFGSVSAYFEGNAPIFGEDLPQILEDLRLFHNILQQNYLFFLENLRAWQLKQEGGTP